MPSNQQVCSCSTSSPLLCAATRDVDLRGDAEPRAAKKGRRSSGRSSGSRLAAARQTVRLPLARMKVLHEMTTGSEGG